MKELKAPMVEPYEVPAILEIVPVTIVRGDDESGNPVEEPDNPGGDIPD